MILSQESWEDWNLKRFSGASFNGWQMSERLLNKMSLLLMENLCVVPLIKLLEKMLYTWLMPGVAWEELPWGNSK